MNANSPLVSLQDIREEILDLETSQDRLSYLVELGDTLPPMPPEQCTQANRVLGCQSMVWLDFQLVDGVLHFVATSDAPMVRGLIAILLAAYSGNSPEAILAFPMEAFLEEIHLKSFLSPMRSNGLHSMILRIRQIASSQLSSERNEAIAIANETRQVPTKRLEDVRQDFPILGRIFESGHSLVYLDNAASSQRPKSVIDRLTSVFERHYSNAHRSGHELAAETTSAIEDSRTSLQRFLNAASTREIVFTSGTTASINLVARTWGDQHLHPGDEILLTEMEHHSNIVPWQQLAIRKGATIRWLPVRDDFQLDLDLLPKLLSAKTKIVALTAVSNVLGTINPVRQIVDAAHAVGATVLVDAAQSVPHAAADVQSMDADFVCFSGHKMLGPTGIGVLYGKENILESMDPFLGGGNMIRDVSWDGFSPADLPHRFEAGTAAIAEIIAFKPAVEYLQALGSQSILDHEQTIMKFLHQRLASLRELQFFGPNPELKSGIMTFVIRGMHSDMVGRMLDAEGIAIRVGHHCAMPLHQKLGQSATCRASFYFYNTIEEAERFAVALEGIASRFLKA